MISLQQKELAVWQEQNFVKGSTDRSEWCALGMAEEVGELSHALLKRKQGIREGQNSDLKEEIGDAFADVVIYGIQLMTCEGINAEKVLEETFRKVLNRNWRSSKITKKAGLEDSNAP